MIKKIFENLRKNVCESHPPWQELAEEEAKERKSAAALQKQVSDQVSAQLAADCKTLKTFTPHVLPVLCGLKCLSEFFDES